MTVTSERGPGERETARRPSESRRIVPVRHYSQWAFALVAALAFGWFVYALATSKNLDWSVFAEYLFNPSVLRGVLLTVEISTLAFIASVVCGTVLALCRLAGNPVLRTGARLYVWFFRSVPLILMIFLFGNLALLFPRIVIKIPATDVTFFSWSTNTVVTVFVASVLAITIHDAAPNSEIIRGAIIGVPRGQVEAAKALGMAPGRTLHKIVLPQALRLMIPALANQLVNILKQTSLVAVIAGGDLMTEVTNIYAVNFRTIELLFVAAFWYLLLVSAASLLQGHLERRSNKGYLR